MHLNIELICASSHEQIWSRCIQVPAGMTVGAVLTAQCVSWQPDQVGIWGRVVGLDQVLQDGDRIELYRPLQIDPKEARFRRVRAQKKGL